MNKWVLETSAIQNSVHSCTLQFKIFTPWEWFYSRQWVFSEYPRKVNACHSISIEMIDLELILNPRCGNHANITNVWWFPKPVINIDQYRSILVCCSKLSDQGGDCLTSTTTNKSYQQTNPYRSITIDIISSSNVSSGNHDATYSNLWEGSRLNKQHRSSNQYWSIRLPVPRTDRLMWGSCEYNNCKR